jgi:2EXR family
VPVAPPTRERRALTPPLLEEQGQASPPSQSLINSQGESPFFVKLPFELRILIYEELFCHRRVHLLWTYRSRPDEGVLAAGDTWWHCGCRSDSRLPFWEDNCYQMELAGHRGKRLDIAILRACRRAYAYFPSSFFFISYCAMKRTPRTLRCTDNCLLVSVI